MSTSHVLVVDTNPETHKKVGSVLVGSGFSLLQASDGAEAQRLCNGKDIALVLSNVSLPRGNGYDLARSIRSSHPAASVLLLVGGFEVFNNPRAIQAGVDGHLPVPFSADTLRNRMQDVLGPLGEPEQGPAPRPMSPLPPAEQTSANPHRGPISRERYATLMPRDFRHVEPVQVDPDVVGPAMEGAILEVLPEVVEGVLRNLLTSDSDVLNTVADLVAQRLSETGSEPDG